ncbi:glycine--tRNA ligase subunit beta, partial [Paenibacillus sepulcri]|nr:glycine--tRNA ligase subunit beta [Paenibacillus sepulcri]
DEFKLAVDALNRVSNLASKAASKNVAPSLFADEAEGELYAAWQAVSESIVECINNDDAAGAIAKLAGLKEPITAYFDRVMVMAEDEAVRANRLALLALIADGAGTVADLSRLVW